MRVVFSSRADRDIGRLARELVRRVMAAIRGLEQDPRPAGCLMLRGRSGPVWRIRVGDWRVTYEIDGDAGEVRVLRILHRSDRAYRA